MKDEDWKTIELISQWLLSFVVTTQMSATKHARLLSTHAIFKGHQDDLMKELWNLPSTVQAHLHNALVESHRKLSDYFFKVDQLLYPIWASHKHWIHVKIFWDTKVTEYIETMPYFVINFEARNWQKYSILKTFLETKKLRNYFSSQWFLSQEIVRNHTVVHLFLPLYIWRKYSQQWKNNCMGSTSFLAKKPIGEENIFSNF